MKRKDFWKGFGAALALVLVVSVAWNPICRIIPWHALPFSVGMSREAKIDIIQSYLDKYYVDDLKEEQVEEMLYAGMMAGVGDRYTYYLTKENLKQYMDNSNGNFDGVGIEVYSTQDGEVIVSSVMAGQPAEAAGMKAGDVIIGVDGQDMRGSMLSDVAAKIRGREGTEVTIKVLRRSTGETMEFTMERAKVVLESVSSRMMEEKIGYISISGFKENTYTQFKEALDELQKEGMKGLILDLRDNPGGLVRSVYEIGEELLPEGTMVYTLDKNENRNDLKCDGEYLDIPLVVLVNANSASASEIFAGAVKDMDRGTLVGTQTFGKGLVQTTRPLPFNSLLKLTIAKYYIPSGRLIQEIDYSHRNPDGTFKHKPDSLCNVFHTAHGREVRDGGGITPDIKVTFPEVNRLVYNIVRDQWAFDYATKYAAEHPTIAPAGEFEITDEIFNDFKKFIDPNKFQYDKLCETGVSLLRKTAETEGYMTDSVKAEFDKLEKMLKHDLNHDLDRNRKEISRQLSSEIVKRYYYDAGECENELKFHKAMDEAVAMFNKPGEYKKILRK